MKEIEKIFELAKSGDLSKSAQLIRNLIDSGQDLAGVNINLAHILFLAADWAYINRLLPKNTNIFSKSGFLKSIGMGRPLNEDGDPIPWFTYPAIDFLNQITQKEWTVFEYGSGNSTLWWSSKVKSVVSVEDNKDWFEEVSKQIPNNARVIYKCKKEYPSVIQEFPEKEFDVIVVDGSKRNECVKSSISRLKENGILVFDNSDRSDYVESSAYLNSLNFYRIDFWGLIPSYLYKNCTSIYSRSPSFLLDQKSPDCHKSDVGISCCQAMEQNKPQSGSEGH